MTDACLIQFGTSRFLQAHVDLFASEAAEAGQDVPEIVVVQTSGDAARAARVAAFGQPGGYPVVIRGLGRDGLKIDRTVTVTSVSRGMAASRDWQDLVRLFTTSATAVLSNVGDGGYRVANVDRSLAVVEGEYAPKSFPAILLALMYARWRHGNFEPLTMLPCELVQRNGDTLKRIIVDFAGEIGVDNSFRNWLEQDCVWVNSLVDRIVSEPIEPVGAVAEPYALWAVEKQPGLSMPFAHPDVVLTDNLEHYERLKLHILNLGHSWLAQRWIDSGRPVEMIVRAALDDLDTADALSRIFVSEVVPGFAAHGLGDQAAAYVLQTMARFRNPFLAHRIADIANDHDAKLAKRVGEFLCWVSAAANPPAMPELAKLASHAGAPVS